MTWILVGGIIGAVATWIGMGGRRSRPGTILAGVVGGVAGGLAMSTFAPTLVPADPMISAAGAAFAGGLVGVFLRRLLGRRSHRRGSFVGPFYAP